MNLEQKAALATRVKEKQRARFARLRKVHQMRKDGCTYSLIAAELSVSRSYVGQLVTKINRAVNAAQQRGGLPYFYR